MTPAMGCIASSLTSDQPWTVIKIQAFIGTSGDSPWWFWGGGFSGDLSHQFSLSTARLVEAQQWSDDRTGSAATQRRSDLGYGVGSKLPNPNEQVPEQQE